MHWGFIQSYLERTVKRVFWITALLTFIHFFLFRYGQINGESMAPTLADGKRFVVDRTAYFFSAPQRLDVVQILDPEQDGKLLVKRVIGMPGEMIILRGPNTYVVTDTDEELVHTAPQSSLTFQQVEEQRIVIPDNSYYVLGDNRAHSRDSRDFGPLHRIFVNGPLRGVE